MWVCRGPVTVQRFLVKAGADNSIKAGEPVIQNAAGGDEEYVVSPGAAVTTADTFVGIAVSTSTDTTAADGYVEVAIPTFGTVYRGQALVKASLADSLRLTKVTMDYTGTKYTIAQSTTASGFCQIVDFNAYTGEIDFLIDMSEALNA